jgi:hypothetical protein
MRGGWVGRRVIALVIGSGGVVLGAAFVLLATERVSSASMFLLSLPGVAGVACLLGGTLLLTRSIRG